eukprot:8261424-Karenia_brevis.AAC.1
MEEGSRPRWSDSDSEEEEEREQDGKEQEEQSEASFMPSIISDEDEEKEAEETNPKESMSEKGGEDSLAAAFEVFESM